MSVASYISKGSFFFVSISNVPSRMCAKKIHCGLRVVFVCLHITLSHYHHYTNLSESIEHIKCFQVYSVECVFKIKSTVAIIFYAIYRAVCVQFKNFSLKIVKIFVLRLFIIIKSQMWIMGHSLGLGHDQLYVLYVLLCYYGVKWHF